MINMGVNYEGVWIYSPHSHLWSKMKRVPKGTKCQVCGTTDDLMAYRGTYSGKNTLCESCLKKVRKKDRPIEKEEVTADFEVDLQSFVITVTADVAHDNYIGIIQQKALEEIKRRCEAGEIYLDSVRRV